MENNAIYIKIKQLLSQFVLPKIPFAITSFVATLADYCIYLLLVYLVLPSTISNIISSSIGMIINFILQKKFVFLLRRKTMVAFLLSVSFSLVGITISTNIIWLLTQLDFFAKQQYITKIIVIGIIFFYNYYTKKFAFEKKLKQLRESAV